MRRVRIVLVLRSATTISNELIKSDPLGGSSRSEDGDATSLRVECSSSDGDDEENGIDLLSLRFDTNREEQGYDFAAATSSINDSQTPSTSASSVNVNAAIKVIQCRVSIG